MVLSAAGSTEKGAAAIGRRDGRIEKRELIFRRHLLLALDVHVATEE